MRSWLSPYIHFAQANGSNIDPHRDGHPRRPDRRRHRGGPLGRRRLDHHRHGRSCRLDGDTLRVNGASTVDATSVAGPWPYGCTQGRHYPVRKIGPFLGFATAGNFHHQPGSL